MNSVIMVFTIFVAEVTTPAVERVSATYSRVGQYETAAAVVRR